MNTPGEWRRPRLRQWLPLGVVVLALGVFLVAPWPLAQKSHAVLHGLCAQTPSHTILLGGRMLPFDARMTGIYSGVALVMIVLGWRTRFRFAGIPKWPILVLLASFVLAMALDGFNSFFLDLRVWHPYTPQNWLRLVTGLGAGISLGVTLAYLIASTFWSRTDFSTPVVNGQDLLRTGMLSLVLIGLVLSGWGFLYSVVTILLVISAVAVLCVIALVMMLLLRETANRWRSLHDMQTEGAIGILLGMLMVAMLAGGRFALEHWLGIPMPM